MAQDEIINELKLYIYSSVVEFNTLLKNYINYHEGN